MKQLKKAQSLVKIIRNQRIASGYFKITLSAPAIAKAALPGQFININVRDGYDPLLRRPLSMHRVLDKRNIELLFEVVGKGTNVLSRKKPGQLLDVVGPLGKGFDLKIRSTSDIILVAGGMGVAPLIFLADELKKIKNPKAKIIVMLGAQTKNKILCEKEFKQIGCDVEISSDDGSRGYRGFIARLLNENLHKRDCMPAAIFACGPHLMLKEISRISKRYNIPTQISLEEHMACGIGACFGCAVATIDGYRRVCKDGPVFNVGDIIF